MKLLHFSRLLLFMVSYCCFYCGFRWLQMVSDSLKWFEMVSDGLRWFEMKLD